MVTNPEPFLDSLGCAVEAGFEGGWRFVVLDSAAGGADEVVVVAAGDGFGELVLGDVVGGDDSVHCACVGEGGQAAVGGAGGEGGDGGRQLGDAQGSIRGGEGFDDLPAAFRPAPSMSAEELLDRVVDSLTEGPAGHTSSSVFCTSPPFEDKTHSYIVRVGGRRCARAARCVPRAVHAADPA